MSNFFLHFKKVVLFCIKWRYLIALCAMIIGVVFQLHGSSINCYNLMFENSEQYNNDSIVLGDSRGIRSDEWLVNVPNQMSQQYNGFEKNSNMMSLGGQDMTLAGAPVLDITILARPFLWGYVLLGNEYGLSWFWCSKLILLLLVSFEFCMIITQKNKRVSLIGVLLLSFAPAMQWWGMIDAYIWGMALVVLGYRLFVSRRAIKNICMVLAPFAAIAFFLVLYPTFQWPTVLVMVALLVGLLIRDKKQIVFNKKDILRIGFIVLVTIGILIYILLTSWDGIKAMSSTSYPGAVVATGGDKSIKDLFTDLTSFVLPYKDIPYLNNSEVSTFIQFSPIFLMLYPMIYRKMKRDRNMLIGNILVTCIVIMGIFMLIGFPELLAKLTLFSMITRTKITYGFIATIFTIWGIDMVWRKKILSAKVILAVLMIWVFLYSCFIGPEELSYLRWWQYLVIIAGFTIIGFLLLKGYRRFSSLYIFALMAVCGMTVNPIARGANALFEHPLERKIAEIASEDESYWLAVNDGRLASIAVANGAKTLNMVNLYPDFKKWELIDVDEEDKDIYNRYAHINVVLTARDTEIDLGASRDVIDAKLSCTDVSKWQVEYLLSSGQLIECQAGFDEIYADSEGDYYIYKKMENK